MRDLRNYILEGIFDIDTNVEQAAPVTKEELNAIDWTKYKGYQPRYWPFETLRYIEKHGNKFKSQADLNANFRCMLNPEYTDDIRQCIYNCIVNGLDARPAIELAKGNMDLLESYLWWTYYTKGNLKAMLPYQKGNKYDKYQLNSIAGAIGLGVDVKMIANPKLKSAQMNSLINSMEDGADISKINNPAYDEEQMRMLGRAQIKFKKEQFEALLNPKITKFQIKQLYEVCEYGFDISTVDWSQYSETQTLYIVKNILNGKDVTPILDPNMPLSEMKGMKLKKLK